MYIPFMHPISQATKHIYPLKYKMAVLSLYEHVTRNTLCWTLVILGLYYYKVLHMYSNDLSAFVQGLFQLTFRLSYFVKSNTTVIISYVHI